MTPERYKIRYCMRTLTDKKISLEKQLKKQRRVGWSQMVVSLENSIYALEYGIQEMEKLK